MITYFEDTWNRGIRIGEGGMTRYLFFLSPNYYLHQLSKILYKERAILIVRDFLTRDKLVKFIFRKKGKKKKKSF